MGSLGNGGIAGVIVVLVLAVLLFLLCREIVLWYWRVGEPTNAR